MVSIIDFVTSEKIRCGLLTLAS
uniref:Uncharacterized protein n=1 Tax=Arundo donax TaxID=35708 RepID=A0A0A9H0C3_ARUDO